MPDGCVGKVALVTGGSRGLGKAVAKRFAAEGATVALTARTMEPDPKYVGSLSETLDEIRAAGGNAVAIQADLSSFEERERMFAEVVEQVGAPDILVNNAAVTFLRPLDEFPEKRARLMVEMHVLAPLHLTEMAIPAMRERKQGWVLMMTSLAGERIDGPPFSEFDTSAGFGMYGTVKAALEPIDAELRRRALRRRHRRQRRRAVEAGGDRRSRRARPGERGHGGHQPRHRDRLHPLHGRPRHPHRAGGTHATVPPRGRLAPELIWKQSGEQWIESRAVGVVERTQRLTFRGAPVHVLCSPGVAAQSLLVHLHAGQLRELVGDAHERGQPLRPEVRLLGQEAVERRRVELDTVAQLDATMTRSPTGSSGTA